MRPWLVPLLLLVALGSMAGAALCATGSYYKAINVTASSSEPAGYQVLLNVSWNSHMQHDFRDIRFCNSTDSGYLPYYIRDHVNSSFANVYVKMDQAFNSSGVTLYMHYNGTDVSSNGSGLHTFFLYDNWSSGVYNSSGLWCETTNNPTVFTSDGFVNGKFASCASYGEGYAITVRGNLTGQNEYASMWGDSIGSLSSWTAGRDLDGNWAVEQNAPYNTNVSTAADTSHHWFDLCRSNSSSLGIFYVDNASHVSLTDTNPNTALKAIKYTNVMKWDTVFVRMCSFPEPFGSFGDEQPVAAGSVFEVLTCIPNVYQDELQECSVVLFNATGGRVTGDTGVWNVKLLNGSFAWSGTTSELGGGSYYFNTNVSLNASGVYLVEVDMSGVDPNYSAPFNVRVVPSVGLTAADVWSFNGSRNLTYVDNIAAGVWSYANRTLSDVSAIVSGVWGAVSRTLTQVVGVSNVTTGDLQSWVWNASSRNLTYYNTSSSSCSVNWSEGQLWVWNATDRNLTYYNNSVDWPLGALFVWNATDRNLTFYPPVNATVNVSGNVTCVSNLTAGDVWNYSSRSLNVPNMCYAIG